MSRTMYVLRRNRWQVVGVAAFVAVSLLLTMLVAGTLRGSSGASEHYSAVFRNASGLSEGDDVRIAGVRVGNVDSVELDGTHARVEFTVARDQHVYADTNATVQFLNLLGQRYVDLQSTERKTVRDPGSTIPLSQTHEGLDLTAIFNAFRPLFETIKPEDVNALATNIVQVLQGEGATLEHLTRQTALLTGHLVDRDQVIGAVIENLTVVMETLNGHRAEFRSMIEELNNLTGVIAKNREQIGATIDGMQGLVTEFASLLSAGGGSVIRDVDALAAWAASFKTIAPKVAAGLRDTRLLLLGFLRDQGLGSYLNAYVCESKVQVAGSPTVDLSTSSARSRRCK